MLQRFIRNIHGDTHILEQLGGIYEILACLLHYAPENRGSRTVYGPDCHIPGRAGRASTKHYK